METERQSSSGDPNFSQRKKDHIEISLRDESQSPVDQFSKLQFQHNPIPEINFEDVTLDTSVFGHPLASPLFVSSMTLGHEGAASLNETLLTACREKGWMMGVGSQRRQLFDPKGQEECERIRAQFPNQVIFGNIGLSQVIASPIRDLQGLVEALGAQFIVVHTNPLQEVMQPEGTPQFKGGLAALQRLCEELPVPVVFKETGCGFSLQSLQAIREVGLSALDVAGRGGTHWGLVEGLRQPKEAEGYRVAQTFATWGLSTVESLENGLQAELPFPLWASGGVRDGLQAAKLLALGAEKVGFAQPILQAALQGPAALHSKMEQLDHELKVAMFCLGIERVEALVGKRKLLRWI